MRFCRCKLNNTPHRKETIVINDMTCCPPNEWGPSLRMCSTSYLRQPPIVNNTRKHQSAVCGGNAALSAEFESEMTLDLARACFVELALAYHQSL